VAGEILDDYGWFVWHGSELNIREP
jgi:hypothetical protein